MATAPRMKPAKPVGKRTEKLRDAKDTAAELTRKKLRAKAEHLFKDFRLFGNLEELKAAADWQALTRLFIVAGGEYASVSSRERDPVAWVEEKLRSDRYAIAEHSATTVFRIRQVRSCENVSFKQVRDVCDSKLDFAMGEGIHIAAERIESKQPQGSGYSNAAIRADMPDYRSEVKIAVFGRLTQKHDASDRQLCEWLDTTGNVELPSRWAKHGNRSFVDAYADDEIRPRMESRFSEVRRDMREAGHPIP